MNTIDDLFRNKNEVKFYVPIGIPNKYIYTFVLEMLNIICAYITPLIAGISKDDVYDYITSQLYANMDILTYLKHKRYVADIEEFKNIMLKYANKANNSPYIDCYEVSVLVDTTSNEVFNATEITTIIVQLNENDPPDDISENVTIKKAYYLIKMAKFSYMVPV